MPNQTFRALSVATAKVLNGKELSYNNLLDLDSALNLVREFRTPAACVIKHNNPCGAALGETLSDAFQKAYEGDPVSAFGGILAFNRELDEATATLITEPNRFVEAIIAPGYSDAALKLLTTRPKWGKNVRILSTGRLEGGQSPFDYRRVDGGLLVQVARCRRRRLRGGQGRHPAARRPTPSATTWYLPGACAST